MIPGKKPKKILTEKVITCIEEYLGKTFSCRYAINSKVLWLSIYIYFLLKGCSDFSVARGITFIVVLKNVSKNLSVKKIRRKRGLKWDSVYPITWMFARLLVIFATWWTIEKRKTKRRTMKGCISVWATFDSFFFQDHVPGIMLIEFKVVMHAFWNDHYQGAGRTPTRNFISRISFSFVKCEPCMTEHTRMLQDFNTLIQWIIVMWPLSVKIFRHWQLQSITASSGLYRETLKTKTWANEWLYKYYNILVLEWFLTVNVSLSSAKHRSNQDA